MLTAIALVALVAVAMAAVGSMFRLNLRRTGEALADAQLRQLLIAGERAARERLASAKASDAVPSNAVRAFDHSVPLPAPLAAAGGSLKLRIQPARGDNTAATVEATVEAALEGRSLSQALRYERGPAGWTLAAAELHGSEARESR